MKDMQRCRAWTGEEDEEGAERTCNIKPIHRAKPIRRVKETEGLRQEEKQTNIYLSTKSP